MGWLLYTGGLPVQVATVLLGLTLHMGWLLYTGGLPVQVATVLLGLTLHMGWLLVDAKLWQIAKPVIVWAGIVREEKLEKVETVEPHMSKMLKSMEAAPLETQLIDQWKEEQVAELMGDASLVF
jgi:hypothetical protein